ncbi:MAG: M24 family metallopeptidase [Betaproteobacteria bacterium]
MTADIDRKRAARWMAAQRLDALLLAKPETFRWATGASPGVAAFFRRAGAALALVPADPSAPVSAVSTELFAPSVAAALGSQNVYTHPDWVETADFQPWAREDTGAAELTERSHRARARPPGFSRPAAYDASAAFAALGQLLHAKGLRQARVGLDLDFWPVADFEHLKRCVQGPVWFDAGECVGMIKAVKSSAEIERLARAAALAEAGMRSALAIVQPGIHRNDIAAAWQSGARQQAERQGWKLSGQWEYITVGSLPWQGGTHLNAGDVLKFDVGCLIEGYSSDSGRTFTLGRARPRSSQIMAALSDAFEAGLEQLRPDRLFSDVHAASTLAMRRAGFASFSRGHWGHSLGHDTFCEVAPFIAAQAHVPIEPGMVLAFETPFYADGEGGFIIEDQFLITEGGPQPAWSLPRGLRELPL